MKKEIFYSVTQYARKKKISRQAVLKAIKKKKIKAIKVGNVWIIIKPEL
jgi:predicted small secreted protein